MTVSSKNHLVDYFGIGDREIKNASSIAVLVVLAIVSTIPVMWVLNVAGYQGYNIVFMIAGALLSLIWASNPNNILLAMSGGSVVNKLLDRDGSQGAVMGFKTYARAIAKVLFYYFWICLLLTFVSFKTHPSVFWYIVPVLMFGATMSIAFNINTDKRTVLMGNIFISGVMLAALMVMAFSPSDGTPSINNMVSTAYGKATSNEPWFPAANSTQRANCPVRTCIFVNSTEWSKQIPVGEGIDWTRNIVEGTVLALRVDGNDNMTKLWVNGKSPSFKSGSYIQVRLVEGTGAMAYFDSPSHIAAFKRQK